MAATLSATIAAGAYSAEVTVTPNAIYSVQSDRPVSVQSKNSQSSPATWTEVAKVGLQIKGDGASPIIATGETIRIQNTGVDAAHIEVFAP